MAAGATSTPEIRRFIWDIGLGYGPNGDATGLLTIRTGEFSEIASRSALRLLQGKNPLMETFSDSSGLRRIRTDILVDLEPSNQWRILPLFFILLGPFLRRFALDSAAAVLISDHPWRRIQIEPVAGAVELRILHVQPNGTAELLKKHLVEFDPITKAWSLATGSDTALQRTITHTFNSAESEALIEISEGSDVVRRKKKTYQLISGQSDIQTVVSDFEGNDYTSNFQFSSDAERTWLQSVQHESGNWEYYDHDYFGRITRVYRPFQNTPSTPGSSFSGKVTTFTYGQFPEPTSSGSFSFSLVPGQDHEFRTLPTEIKTTIGGFENIVARTTFCPR